MIIKSMNYVIATETDATVFLDADNFLSKIPSILIPAIRIAQSLDQSYITVPEGMEFQFKGETVLEIQWG